jgi:hypothetical protein
MAAVGVADWLTRRVHDDKRAIVAGALVSGQILLTCFSSAFLARTDPNRAWYLVAQNLLQKSDLFVVQSAPRAYLAQFRLDIATRPTNARGVIIHRGTHVDRTLQRLVLDGWAATDGDPLRLPPHEPLSSPDGLELRPEALLTKEGLIPLRQVP